jgi:DnaJ-domain-containing protein 1
MRPNDASIEPTLARLGQAAIGINPGVDFLRFGFGPPEAKTIDMLRALPMPLTQLQSLDVMPVRQLKLLLYVLLLTKGIALVATQSPTASPQPRQPSSPDVRGASMVSSQQPSAQGVPMARVKLKKSMSPVSSAVEEPVNQNRKMVLERAETIGDENYFEVLGITRTDPPDVARSAYFALAKVWHPDRLTGDMEDLREVVSRVFARMSEAFQTLSDPDKRAQYVDALDKGLTAKEEQAQVQQVIEATLEFQKAEVFLRRKDLPNALKAAERAYLGDPEQASHVALFAWILAQQPEALQAATFNRSLSLLEEAIKLNARCEQAYFYRAMLNKQLGNSQSALRDFKTVVELNPRNIDATRELRLATMRGGKASPPSDSKAVSSTSKSTQNAESINWTQDSVGDIIGKIFKKK